LIIKKIVFFKKKGGFKVNNYKKKTLKSSRL
jgi:hypothetical protein